ncbi:hypothetical protein [Novosphingobium sp.]|uniref:hypothetical protein n=1 Tax=Novosphingobium sp. TaxID=1874826 RepID=UPI0038BA480E
MNLVRKGALALGLAASALAAAAPAQAHDYYYDRHRGSDDAAIAIGAGIIGLAVGAAIASDHDDRRYYYRDRGYYYPRYRGGYYSAPVYRGYYYRDDDRRWRDYDRYRHYDRDDD